MISLLLKAIPPILFFGIWLTVAFTVVTSYPGMGGTEAPVVIFSFMNIWFSKSTCYILWITFIFNRCHHSSAAGIPVKYEHDIYVWQINKVSQILKHEHNYWTEEIDLVTPPCYHVILYKSLQLSIWNWNVMLMKFLSLAAPQIVIWTKI